MNLRLSLLPATVVALAACGGGDGPRVEDGAQSIRFEPVPALQAGDGTTLRAGASSGLPVALASLTPAVCTVGAADGRLQTLASGACSVSASQGGNDRFAPAPTVLLDIVVAARAQALAFDAAPALAVDGSATVRALAASGLPVRYLSLTPATCAVDAGSGSLTGLAGGPCTVAADQAGDGQWAAAPRATLTLAVAWRAQALELAALPALRVGESTTARAVAGSGLAASYTSLTTAVCSVDAASGRVVARGAGTCTVAADQAGDQRWAAALQALQSTEVTRAPQTLQWATLPVTLTVGSSTTARASAASGLAARHLSLTPSTCSVDATGGTVTALAVGSCSVAAEQDGDAAWAAAPPLQQTLAVLGMPQTLAFGPAPALAAGGSATVRATASSGLAVAYTSQTPAVCSVGGGGLVSALTGGTCTVAASQTGDSRWAAAPTTTQSLAVARATQTLAFGGAPSLVAGGSATVTASASSGLAPSYGSQTPAVCSVQATSGSVTGLAIGSCSIVAQQAGNAVWAPAAQATLGFAVAGQAQTIAFGAAPALVAGGTATVRATASSGLAVAYGSLTPGVCSVHPSSGLVTSLVGGACSIAASQAGNATWAAAPQAVQTLGVAVAPQTLAFGSAPGPLTVGDTATVRASASSGLAATYTSLSASVCSVGAGSGAVAALASGTCTIAATQAGNASWAPAPQVVQALTVVGRAQTLAFGSAPALTVGAAAAVRASASSGLAAVYGSLSPSVCSVDAASGSVTGLAAGSCSIAADQAGSAAWAAAPQAVQTFAVALAPQTLSFGPAPALTVGGTATVRATASSGLPASYASLTAATCSVAADGTVGGLAIGGCTIAAQQAGNGRWAAAPQATLSFAVAGRAQSIAFGTAPALQVGGTAAVHAAASSGLAVAYASLTASVCSVEAASGRVAGLATGSCRIAADQAGNATWAAAPQAVQTLVVAPDPAQSIAFAAAPVLTLGGTATVRATASSGLAVRYGSRTPGVCGVDAASGLVGALALGDCIVTADQAGDARWLPAPQATLTLPVQAPAGSSVPAAPQGVAARLDGRMDQVVVSAAAVDSGGLPVTGYTVSAKPAGPVVSAAALPVAIACGGSCAGLGFSVRANNALGDGAESAVVDVLTVFDVQASFHEPDTQPRDTIFTGSFTLNSTRGSVSGLAGELTESMTGNAVGSPPFYDMTRIPLVRQLQSWRDAALGGRFVASFAREVTSTFTTLAGGDGWSPAAGIANGGIYAGFPAPHAGTVRNSYVLIFVPDDPFVPLTQAQIDRLAYADCAAGGMMGAVCMTATSVAGYGSTGTMSGYPVAQTLAARDTAVATTRRRAPSALRTPAPASAGPARAR